jgi:hypothetical protein
MRTKTKLRTSALILAGLVIGFTAAVFAPAGMAVTTLGPNRTGSLVKTISSSSGGGGGGSGLTPIADQTTLANVSGSTANPSATSASAMRTMLGVKALPLALTDVATIANGTVLANISGSTASPTAVQQEDVVTVTGSATSSWSLAGAFGGINGETDGRYRLECYLVFPASTNAVSYRFRPNNVGTGQFYVVMNNNGSTVTSGTVGDNATPFFIFNAGTTNAGVAVVTIEFEGKTGQLRHFHSAGMKYDATATVFGSYYTDGYWSDTSTPLTDMVLVPSSGSNIGVGSRCKVRRNVGVQ